MTFLVPWAAFSSSRKRYGSSPPKISLEGNRPPLFSISSVTACVSLESCVKLTLLTKLQHQLTILFRPKLETLMVAFVPAQVLKENYQILGNFYTVEITTDCILECRNVLEIVAKPLADVQVQAIPKRKPDAVFVMMNPGSSQPLVDVDYRIKADQIAELSISLVPTKPDTTQYQVMRVMRCYHLQHVRVLNLSDLRCTKSPLFIRKYKQLEAEHAFEAHSLFSRQRRRELKQQMLKYTDIPIVRAWGVSPHLEPLIQRCEKSLQPMQKLGGLLKEGTTNKYLHPLPSLQKQQEDWVNRMVDLWGELS